MNKLDLNLYPLKIVLTLLVSGGTILACLLAASVFVGTSALSVLTPVVMKPGLLLISFCGFIYIIFLFIMIISAIKRKEIIFFINTRHIWLKYFLPVGRSIAKRIGVDTDKFIRSCVNLNNEFILKMKSKTKVSNILILLPHCLQLHSCGMKLTSDVHNCKKCGRCVVGSLIELSDGLNVDIFVASGGTMARQQIIKKRPDVILAVACERDLLSGIRDTLPINVIGILNKRPEGPCRNTTVETAHIAELIKIVKKAS